MSGSAGKDVILEVSHLKKYFPVAGRQFLKAVDDVSFSIYKGETFGLVGESKMGESQIASTPRSLM